MWVLQNRWKRDWRLRRRSRLSISFSHSLGRSFYYGSMHAYLGRLTIEWQVRPWHASVEAHWQKRVKPLGEWTAAEKREAGIIDDALTTEVGRTA